LLDSGDEAALQLRVLELEAPECCGQAGALEEVHRGPAMDFEVGAMASFTSQTSQASKRHAGQSATGPPVKLGDRERARHDVASLGKTLDQHASALDQTLQAVTELHGMANSIVRRLNHQVPAIVDAINDVDPDVYAPPQVDRAAGLMAAADAVLDNLSYLLESSGAVLSTSGAFKRKFKDVMALRTPEFGLQGFTNSSPDLGGRSSRSSNPPPRMSIGMTLPPLAGGRNSPSMANSTDVRLDNLLGRNPGRRARSVSPTRGQNKALSSSALMMGEIAQAVAEKQWAVALEKLAMVEQVAIMNRLAPPQGFIELRAAAYRGNREFEEATKDYSVIIAKSPMEIPAYVGRGLCYLLHGQPAKALKEFTKAVGLSDPPSALLLLRKAQAENEVKKSEDAIRTASAALRALEREDADALASEQRGVQYRRPGSDVDDLEGGNLAAECHACLGLGLMKTGSKAAVRRQQAEAECGHVLLIEPHYISRRFQTIAHLPITDPEHIETVAELTLMFGKSADVIQANVKSLLEHGGKPEEVLTGLNAMIDCSGKAAGEDSVATRQEARQRLQWAHSERLALAARAPDVVHNASGSQDAVVSTALDDRTQVLELQEQSGDGTTVALNARAHLAVVLYAAGNEANARVEMDAMVAGVSDTMRPTTLKALLKLASTPAGKGLSYGVARFAWAERDSPLAAEWFTKAWAAQYDLSGLAEVGSCFAACLILKREEVPAPPVPPLDLGDGKPEDPVEPEPEPDPVGPPSLLELTVRAEAKRLSDAETASAAVGTLRGTDHLHMGVVLADAGGEVRIGDGAAAALEGASAHFREAGSTARSVLISHSRAHDPVALTLLSQATDADGKFKLEYEIGAGEDGKGIASLQFLALDALHKDALDTLTTDSCGTKFVEKWEAEPFVQAVHKARCVAFAFASSPCCCGLAVVASARWRCSFARSLGSASNPCPVRAVQGLAANVACGARRQRGGGGAAAQRCMLYRKRISHSISRPSHLGTVGLSCVDCTRAAAAVGSISAARATR
jgi:tetratricopeptide (TPR) repeat protein